MNLFYTLSLYIYRFFILIASPFNKKARLWIRGRKHFPSVLKEKCREKDHVICFHCASLGEFEQGKPLMEKIKSRYPHYTVMVTFFSPSGYEIRKNDPAADIVIYLPLDTPRNVKKFLDIVRPEAFFFIKYEFWYNFMKGLASRKIPFFFISAIFRPDQPFFQPWGGWFRKQLQRATFFFVQNEESVSLLQSAGIDNAEIAGDTRFDRVNEIATQQFELDFVTMFKEKSRLIVAGSTWQEDEYLLARVMKKLPHHYKLLIAPHIIDQNHIKQIEACFGEFGTITYSACKDRDLKENRVLILDTMGMLNKVYKYAFVSYVGGAFGKGLHNILEAAVYGNPLFFGPKYGKFDEAVRLVDRGGGFSITEEDEMINKINFFELNEQDYLTTCKLCSDFVETNLGATDKILQRIQNLK